MKFHPGSRGVAVGALLSVSLIGCEPPVDEKKAAEPPPAVTGPSPKPESNRPSNYPAPGPDTSKSADKPPAETAPAPTPEAKPDEKPADKPAETTPVPKDEPKKDEPPK